MEKKTKVAKPAVPQKHQHEALTPEDLDKVVGGVSGTAGPGPLGSLSSNHNQNIV